MHFDKKVYYDCVAYVTSLYFKQYDRDILPLYLSGFGFTYIKSKQATLLEDTIISSKIIPDDTISYFTGLSKSSIEFDKRNFSNELINYFKGNMMLGVFLDSYYCPWNKYYLQMHRKHCVAIVGYDSTSQVLHIYDGYLSNRIETLEMELFKKGYIDSFKYNEVGCPKQLNTKDALNFINDFSCDSFDKRAQHICELHNRVMSFQYDNCYSNSDLEFSDFCMSLTYLIWNRMGLKECLTHYIVHDESLVLDELTEQLNSNIRLWDSYRCCFLKNLFLKSNRYHEKLNTTINSIMDNELSIIELIVNEVE